MSIDLLKKRSKGAADRLADALGKMNKKKSYDKDKRFWELTVDKAGNGRATIRFLPTVAEDESGVPWVQRFNHGFQVGRRWFIEECPTTIGGECPVCEANSELWETNDKKNQDIVRARKRKLSYVSNILVVDDPADPENNGKVFLFRYGAKIFDKIQLALKPEFEEDARFNPFDPWEGQNFFLRARNVENQRNYDTSRFSGDAAKLGSDADIESIWKQCHSLEAFHSPTLFKSYDDLKAAFDKIVSAKPALSQPAQQRAMPVDDEDTDRGPAATAEADSPPWDEDDQTLDYFSKLAND